MWSLEPSNTVRLHPVFVGHERRALRLPRAQRLVLRELGAPQLFGERFRNHLMRWEFWIIIIIHWGLSYMMSSVDGGRGSPKSSRKEPGCGNSVCEKGEGTQLLKKFAVVIIYRSNSKPHMIVRRESLKWAAFMNVQSRGQNLNWHKVCHTRFCSRCYRIFQRLSLTGTGGSKLTQPKNTKN